MAEKTTPAAPVPTVRVYNRSGRTFIHGKHLVSGNTFTDLPEDVATLLLEGYPSDIVESGVASRELNGAAIALAEANTKLAAAEARIAELEKPKKTKPSASDAV